MSNVNSIENLKVSESELKQIEALSLSLLSLSDAYDLPDSVRSLSEDINDRLESLRMKSVVEHHNELSLVNN